MDAYKHIEHIADALSIGETKRIDCPTCKGKKTFTITNTMGKLLWNCYKASCSVGGNKKINLTVDQIKEYKREDTTDDTFELPEYIVPNGLHHHDVKENRIVFLIKKGDKIVDAVGRSAGKRLPKWKRYGKSKMPYVAWSALEKTCVLVEDCFSAYYVMKLGVTGVAILGTSLLEEHKQFLSENFSRVIVALDPDALPKTLQVAKELKGWVIEVKVLKLTDDLKYAKDIDIKNLQELVWN